MASLDGTLLNFIPDERLLFFACRAGKFKGDYPWQWMFAAVLRRWIWHKLPFPFGMLWDSFRWFRFSEVPVPIRGYRHMAAIFRSLTNSYAGEPFSVGIMDFFFRLIEQG